MKNLPAKMLPTKFQEICIGVFVEKLAEKFLGLRKSKKYFGGTYGGNLGEILVVVLGFLHRGIMVHLNFRIGYFANNWICRLIV